MKHSICIACVLFAYVFLFILFSNVRSSRDVCDFLTSVRGEHGPSWSSSQMRVAEDLAVGAIYGNRDSPRKPSLRPEKVRITSRYLLA